VVGECFIDGVYRLHLFTRKSCTLVANLWKPTALDRLHVNIHQNNSIFSPLTLLRARTRKLAKMFLQVFIIQAPALGPLQINFNSMIEEYFIEDFTISNW